MDDEDLLTKNFFLVHLHGQIEWGEFPVHNYDNLYCKCLFRYGPDWAVVGGSGDETKEKSRDKVFVTQRASRPPNDNRRSAFIWNLPMEMTFKSSNVFGWPQVVVSVFGIDQLGNDVVRGYGWAHVPTRPGEHRLPIRLFAPQPTSMWSRLANRLVDSHRQPEFVDSRLAAGHEGRQLVTVDNHGEQVQLLLNVILKDFKKYGFISR